MYAGVALNSVDFQPNGVRIATAGAGTAVYALFLSEPLRANVSFVADGYVKIWAAAPICSEAEEGSSAAKRLCGELHAHTANVHAVRWSPSGQCVVYSIGSHALVSCDAAFPSQFGGKRG